MRLLTLRTIVVATDLDASSHPALSSAHRLAAAAGAALHVVLVAPAPYRRRDDAPVHEDAAEAVRSALREVNVPDGDASIHVIPGAPADTIRSLAERMGADVIVVGPHRERDRVTGGHALGGTAREIVERADVPCLIVARPLKLPLERVLVPIDFSDTARGALLVGLSWASALRAGSTATRPTTLTALHVEGERAADATARSEASLERELGVLRGEQGAWAGVDVEGRVAQGADPARVIGRYALDHEADLVVVGTRGVGADDVDRLGSVSASVTVHVQVPTLLVPPSVWRAHAAG